MSKERVKQYRLRQKELGRLKREMYLTDSEFLEFKAKLSKMRNDEANNDKLKNTTTRSSKRNS